jgi:hypothetical protein
MIDLFVIVPFTLVNKLVKIDVILELVFRDKVFPVGENLLTRDELFVPIGVRIRR